MAIFGLIIYLINYFLGKQLNRRLALELIKKLKPLLENNFEHLGVGQKDKQVDFDEISANMFNYYASGRINLHYLLIQCELKKR